MMDKDMEKELVLKAIGARKNSYSPYSGFSVGAALLTKSGKVYTGVNIENASYTPSLCAERLAFSKAVSEKEKDFEAIAVVGGEAEGEINSLCPPCGVCRQVMMEFCDPSDFKIILAKNYTEWKVFTLKELLPMGFGPADLD